MQGRNKRTNRTSRLVYYICVFPMLGAMMFASKLVMSALPNIHLVGMFCITITVVYRAYALIPIYIYVFLEGIFYGPTVYWVPYLYVWTVLWGVCMLFPKKMNTKLAFIIYPVVCALHGACFGILCAPAQALFSGYTFEMTVAWVLSGLPFDMLHAIGNFASGFLVLPLSSLLMRLEGRRRI